MTLTECMLPSADGGGGFDCSQCGLHVDQCVQEDDLHLQDERYQISAETGRTATGRALSTVAQRTLRFSDSARRALATNPITRHSSIDVHVQPIRQADIFADAPLSNGRQAELKSFTFRHSHAPHAVEHSLAYNTLPTKTSPRFSLRTIPRAVAASTSDESERLSLTEFAADEVSVDEDYFELPERPEMSVDGPELDYFYTLNKPINVSVGNLNNNNSVIEVDTFGVLDSGGGGSYVNAQRRPLSLDQDEVSVDGEESSTSADSLSTESGEYSVFSPDFVEFGRMKRAPGVAHMMVGEEAFEKTVESRTIPPENVEMYRLFYPQRVSAQTSSPSISKHVPSVIDPLSPSIPSAYTSPSPVPADDQSDRILLTQTEKVDTCTTTEEQTETIVQQYPHFRPPSSNSIDNTTYHRAFTETPRKEPPLVPHITSHLTPVEQRLQNIQAALRETLVSRTDDHVNAHISPQYAAEQQYNVVEAKGALQPTSQFSVPRSPSPLPASADEQSDNLLDVILASRKKRVKLEEDIGSEQKESVEYILETVVKEEVSSNPRSRNKENEEDVDGSPGRIYHKNPVKKKESSKARLKIEAAESEETGSDMQTAAALRYSEGTFRHEYPSTAQLLASRSKERNLSNNTLDGGVSVSSTLPYTVDGTKVIYPVVRKLPSYASSRVSTTSDLDAYPATPSPSIPDSTFSLASRGSAAGRLSRRSHAVIYFKDRTNTGVNTRPDKSLPNVAISASNDGHNPIEELRRVPLDSSQQLVPPPPPPRRSSSSSSSSGRGIQKLTIKMVLKEKKSDSSTLLPLTHTHIESTTETLSPPTPHRQEGDDLPNGATAANLQQSYQRRVVPAHQRSFSAHASHRSQASHNNTNAEPVKVKLSASEVELCKPEVVNMTDFNRDSSLRSSSIYERRAPESRTSTMSRAYSRTSSVVNDPSKPKPYRSYERLDIMDEEGGLVTRERLEELKNDVIHIQVHEKGDKVRLSAEEAKRIEENEDMDLSHLPARPSIEVALTAPDSETLALPPLEKPPSPRSRRDRYELHQAMSWKREIEVPQARSQTPVSYSEVEYEVRYDQPEQQVPVWKEDTRVVETRSVSAPAPPAREPVADRYSGRGWQERVELPQRPVSPLNSTVGLSATLYSNHEHQSHIAYRSIFDKCYTDERINELRKSANDLRTLADGGHLSTTQPTSTTRPNTTFKYTYPPAESTTSTRTLPPYSYKPSQIAPKIPLSTTDTSETYRKESTYYQSNYSTVERSPVTQHKSTPSLLPTTSLPARSANHFTPKSVYQAAAVSRDYATKPSDTSSRPIPRYEPYDRYNSQTTDTAKPQPGSFAYQPRTSHISSPVSFQKDFKKPAELSKNYTTLKVLPDGTKLYESTAEETTMFSSGVPPTQKASSSRIDPRASDQSRQNVVTSRIEPRSSDPYRQKMDSSRIEPRSSDPYQQKHDTVKIEPRSTGSSWAYGYKLPEEQFRSKSADRPESSLSTRHDPSMKTVEPSVLEALRPKAKPEPPASPDVRPKDWVPPCKAKIMQAKRKYMIQNPPLMTSTRSQADPWERYKSSSRDRTELRISRESLEAINREAARGQRSNNRSSAPNLTGSMKALTDPSVYREKIYWPEREVQAKLSESQEYLSRKYGPDYSDDPTTSSFANRFDSRSRSLPPMSRYSKSAATTPIESPYPEYMDGSKAKSLEYLSEVKKYDYEIVPENQLQKENISGYSRSKQAEDTDYDDTDYSNVVRKSLQKLDLPDWYLSSPYSQPGVMEGTILRNRANSTTGSSYSAYNIIDRSELTSPTGTTHSTDVTTLPRRDRPLSEWNPNRPVSRGTDYPKKPLTLSQEKVWDLYTGPFYNKKPSAKPTRPSAIYSPASETAHRPYNPHDSGWSSDWNSHHEGSSQESDESVTGSRRSPRAWNAKRSVPDIGTSSTASSWYQPPLSRKHSEPAYATTRTAPPYRPANQVNQPPKEPQFHLQTSKKVLQATPWEVLSIKTETFKTENLARKNFVTETNDPVRIQQFSSQSNSQWGSYV